jgi:hypothetical protein
LEDIQTGGLVLFRYSHDIAEQVLQLSHLEPFLRELEPILDKSSPERIVFDPVNSLLVGRTQDDVAARANELAVWVKSFGATVVLVASGENCGILESLTPSVKESFRFDVREICDRVVRFITFEKSSCVPDQAVRVDPSRGISLLQDQQANEAANKKPGLALEKSTSLEACRSNVGEEEPVSDIQTLDDALVPGLTMLEATVATSDASVAGFLPASQSERRELVLDVPSVPSATSSDELNVGVDPKNASDEFFAMLDELQSFTSSLDPDLAEIENACLSPMSSG